MPTLDLTTLLACLHPCGSTTTLRHLNCIALAMLSLSGRVTMRGLSRWAGAGGSYRTLQRFFYTVIPWAQMMWLFVRQHVLRPDDVYILAGDEVVVTKVGKHTHGLDRFFSGLLHKPVVGLAFFTLSLVSTREHRAYPLRVEQVVRTEAEKAAACERATAKKTKAAAPGKPGRPKGSKTKHRSAVSLTPELQRIQAMLTALLALIGRGLTLTYLALDGHLGNNNAVQMALQCGLQLISKLRRDAALYEPYDGPYAGRGPRRKYGAKLDYAQLPARYLKQTFVEDGIETRLYQLQALHKEFSQPLNVVVLVKTNLKTHAWAHIILFSSDLGLAYDKLVEY
jgi:putative transposase